jgi:hypothetical protein
VTIFNFLNCRRWNVTINLTTVTVPTFCIVPSNYTLYTKTSIILDLRLAALFSLSLSQSWTKPMNTENTDARGSAFTRFSASPARFGRDLTAKTDRVPTVEIRAEVVAALYRLICGRYGPTAGALGDHLSYLRDRRWAWPITRSPGTEISPLQLRDAPPALSGSGETRLSSVSAESIFISCETARARARETYV